MKTRIFSMLLAVVLLFTSVDITAFAEEIKDAVDGQTVSENEIGLEGNQEPTVEPSVQEEETEGVSENNVPQTSVITEPEILLEEVASDNIAEGIIENDLGGVTWVIDVNGQLTVSGKGEIRTNGRIPWENYTAEITSAVIELSEIEDASCMFYGCSSLDSVDLSKFDTSKVTNMKKMFADCDSLTPLDVSNFNTSKVTNMSYMFSECGTNALDLSNFDTSNVTNMSSMFEGCGGLRELKISNFDTSNVTTMSSMFNECYYLESIDVSGFNTENVTDMRKMFAYCNYVEELDVSGFDTKNVTDMTEMFWFCGRLTDLDVSKFDTSMVTSMAMMFSGCSSLSHIDVSGFDTKNVTIMSGMFEQCMALTNIDVFGFDTSQVTNMNSMFYYCSALKEIDVSNFNTSNTEEIMDMFHGCSSLTKLDVGNFDTTNAIFASRMFAECTNLQELDLSKINLVNAMYSNGLLSGCNSLTKIHTPLCIKSGTSNELPGTSADVWYKSDGTTLTTLPQGLIKSIVITKNEIPGGGIAPTNKYPEEASSKIHVYVVEAKTGEPIEGAIVNGKTVDNEKGYIAFTEDEYDGKLEVSAEGYISTVKYRDLVLGDTCFITLYTETGRFEIIQADVEIGDKIADVLTDKVYLMHANSDMEMKDTLKLSIATRGDVSSYRLLKNSDVIAENQTGEFSLSVAIDDGDETNGDKIIWTGLNACDELYTEVICEDGMVYKKKLGIFISEGDDSGNADVSGKITWGKKISLDLPDSVPLLGGRTVSFGPEMPLPFEIEVDTNGNAKVAINKASSKSMESFKGDFDKMDSRAKRMSEAAQAFGGTPQEFNAGYLGLECWVYGYGEGYVDTKKPGIYHVDIEVIVGAETTAGYKQYFFVGYLPLYLQIEATATLEGSFGMQAEYDKSTDTMDVYCGMGKLVGNIVLEPAVGGGVDGVASLKFSGKGTANYLYEPKDNHQKVWLDSQLSVKMQVGPFFKKTIWHSKKWTKVLYEERDEEETVALQNFSVLGVDTGENFDEYSSDDYQIMDRSYADSAASLYSTRTVSTDIVQNYVYPSAQPRIISVGEKLYLFWLQDISTRTSENRAALVYSVSKDGSTWSAPKQLIEESVNQTLDMDYDLYVENDKIYICWQDASMEFETGVSLGEALQSIHIAYAVVDAASTELLETDIITDTDGCYVQPKIYVNEGRIKVVWVNNHINTEEQIWAETNVHSLMMYDSGSKETRELNVGEGTEKIINLDIGLLDDSDAVAYILDRDGKYTTTDDRELYFDTRSTLVNGEKMCIDSGRESISSPIIEDSTCYWHADGNIYYSVGGSSEAKPIYEEISGHIPSDFKVVTSQNTTRIIWESIDDETENVNISGIKYLGDDKWSLPYVIEETDNVETDACWGAFLDKCFYMTYLHVSEQSDGSQIHSVRVAKETDYTDLELSYAEYDNDELRPGEALPITAYVANNGSTIIDFVSIVVDGEVLAQKEINLGVSESAVIDFSEYIVSESLSKSEYHTLEIKTDNESDTSNNSYKMKIGMTDVYVLCNQRLLSESIWLDVSVINNSYIPTECTLNIRENAKEGTIVYTEELGVIAAQEGISLTINMYEYENNCGTFYVEIVTDEEDAIQGDNVQFVYTGYGMDVEVGDFTTTPIMYTVTFDSDGGSKVEAQEVVAGSTVYEPISPAKEDYNFEGWKLNGEDYDFNTSITGNITLKASWSYASQLPEVTSTPTSGSKMEVGKKIVLSCAADGADIYYSTDGSEPTTGSILYEGPIEYETGMVIQAFAVLDGYRDSSITVLNFDDAYRVIFDSAGGSEVDAQLIYKGHTVEKPEDPVKEWHYFEGWYLNEELYDFNIPVTEAITLSAHWKKMDDVSAPWANVSDETEIMRGTEIILQSNTAGSAIYYTLDGMMPTEESLLYKEPIVITEDTVVSVIAVKDGFKPSEIVQYNYIVSTVGDVIVDDIPQEGVEAIPQGLWIAGIKEDGYEYTGTAVRPDVRVYNGTTLLKAKEDYTITYKNNIKVNDASIERTAPTIVIEGKGNYSGQLKALFTICPKSIESEEITAENLYVKYNGRVQKKIPSVVSDKGKLRNKLDYIVEYPDLESDENAYKAPGTYNIRIVGIGNYTGVKEIAITVTEKFLISKAYVDSIVEQTYTGSAVTPSISVRYGLTHLVEGEDYEITYKDNVQIGTATVILTGIGTYSGQKSITFEIVGKEFSKAIVNGMPESIVYTGKEIVLDENTVENMPVVTIAEDKVLKELSEEIHYSINYKNNIDKGIAIVSFDGINEYSGSVVKTFRILPYDIGEDESDKIEVYLEDEELEYVKGGNRPGLVVMYGTSILKEGKDYTVKYINNNKVNDGSDKNNAPTVIIQGKGNFTGSVERTYAIKSNNISNEVMNASDRVISTETSALKSEPTITTESGTKLKKGKDYHETLTYCYKEDTILENGVERKAGDLVEEDDIVPNGTSIKVIAIGKGNYEGTINCEYRVVKYDIGKASVDIPKKTYTGSAITLTSEDITVTFGNEELVLGEDFEIVSYSDNTDRGRAKVTIRGLGDYGGTKTVKFTIKSKLLEWWEGVIAKLFG